MAYEKHNWETGEIITAERLNHIEDGIADSPVFIINLSYASDEVNLVADKTVGEIVQAIIDGKLIVCLYRVFPSDPQDYSRYDASLAVAMYATNYFTINCVFNGVSYNLVGETDSDYPITDLSNS